MQRMQIIYRILRTELSIILKMAIRLWLAISLIRQRLLLFVMESSIFPETAGFIKFLPVTSLEFMIQESTRTISQYLRMVRVGKL